MPVSDILCDIIGITEGGEQFDNRRTPKKLRKALDLTQQEFADKLKVSRSNIATYEVGKNNPADAVINLICREFNVSEGWLRTGEGEMFVKQTEDDELAMVFSAVAASDDDLIKRIIRAYWKLDDKEKAAVRKLIDGFTPASSGPAARSSPPLIHLLLRMRPAPRRSSRPSLSTGRFFLRR